MMDAPKQSDDQRAHGGDRPPVAWPVAMPVDAVAPDWATFDGDLPCPLCGYNLRGLSEARCPECGAKFLWRELLDPQRREHKFLFEYHTGSWISSFIVSFLVGLSPWRFWRSVHPVLPIRVGRLLRYSGIVYLFVLAAFAFRQYTFTRVTFTVGWTAWLLRFGGSPMLPWTWTPGDWERVFEANPFPLIVLVWYVGTLASLLIFRVSMRRARIRTAHVLRCVAYSGDAFVLFAIALVAVDGVDLIVTQVPSYTNPLHYVALFGVWIAATIKLAVAYQKYLQFRNAWAVVLASQCIVVLTVFNMFAVRVWM